jgi:hypothetical protein
LLLIGPMKASEKLRLLTASVLFAAVLLQTAGSDRSAAFAQQHNRTDLAFSRERARITATERRIEALRQRLASVERRSVSPAAAPASAAEHVLLSRDASPPPRSAPSNRETVRDDAALLQSERRIPSTLRHRDRAVSALDIGALNQRLDAAEKTARSLGERINRPDFGAGVRALEQHLDNIEAELANLE